MKYIRLQTFGDFSTIEIIRTVIGREPVNGMTFDEMRERLKIAAALDTATEVLALKDEQYALVQRAARGFRWSVSHADLFECLAGIVEDVPDEAPKLVVAAE